MRFEENNDNTCSYQIRDNNKETAFFMLTIYNSPEKSTTKNEKRFCHFRKMTKILGDAKKDVQFTFII